METKTRQNSVLSTPLPPRLFPPHRRNRRKEALIESGVGHRPRKNVGQSLLTSSPTLWWKGLFRLIRLSVVLLFVAALPPRTLLAAPTGHPEYLVGIYYFSGWWREQPNKYFTAGQDWRTNYPGRVPLLGEYNEQETMDREIAAAATNGVSFFQILWYYQGNAWNPPGHEDKLNEGLRLFLASPNNRRMKFTLEFVNHPPFGIEDAAAWERACREWCEAMKHPSYLRLGGRPVFKVHGAEHFFNQNSRDPSRVAKRIETLRRVAREAGLPGLLVGGGVMPGAVENGPAEAPYDFLTTYMDMPNLPSRDKPYPYSDLLQHAEKGWSLYARGSQKPYVPYVPSGWDPRPWHDPRPSFELPNREQWLTALRSVKAALDASINLGIPVEPGKRQKMLLIYAWNEFGEGGMVAPTRDDGDMKLRAIASVFGSHSKPR
jgi:hypothetical protein